MPGEGMPERGSDGSWFWNFVLGRPRRSQELREYDEAFRAWLREHDKRMKAMG